MLIEVVNAFLSNLFGKNPNSYKLNPDSIRFIVRIKINYFIYIVRY